MEGWKDGRMEGWKDGRMDGRMDAVIKVPAEFNTESFLNIIVNGIRNQECLSHH